MDEDDFCFTAYGNHITKTILDRRERISWLIIKLLMN